MQKYLVLVVGIVISLVNIVSCVPNNPVVPTATIATEDTIGYPINLLTYDGTSQLNKVRFSTHFSNWLSNNVAYNTFDFSPSNIEGNGFGGKTSDTNQIKNHPVIFIHGNSDKAIGNTFGQSGWTRSINYFKKNGYSNAELYAFTWGNANPLTASLNYHSKENIMKVRKFIEAVLAYTGAEKVDIIAHSMGVTLARKAIKGGNGNDLLNGGDYSIGSSLTNKVDVFVGIAGANLGLTSCYTTGPSTPTCGTTNGFYPGTAAGGIGLSTFLKELNQTTKFEGSYTYSIWSTLDEIVGFGCIVWGKNTCWIPSQNGHKQYDKIPFGHFGVKDNSLNVQLEMVKNRRVIG